MKAVILTGGLGTRLQPYTLFVPKPIHRVSKSVSPEFNKIIIYDI